MKVTDAQSSRQTTCLRLPSGREVKMILRGGGLPAREFSASYDALDIERAHVARQERLPNKMHLWQYLTSRSCSSF
jgi:ABC-type cobalamin transport system ATPase subunit